MARGKIYTWLSLIIMVSFLLCMGVACSNDKPSDATATPSATTTPEGQAKPQTTATVESMPQGTDAPKQTADGQAGTQSTADGQEANPTENPTVEPPVGTQDNVVTFPPSWFASPDQSDDAEPTATKKPTATQKPTATKQPTATQQATVTQKPTQATGDNEVTLPPIESTPTPTTPEPTKAPETPKRTPIGTDEDGWIDIWV